MPKQEPILEEMIHRILWDFEIQLDYPIYARRQDRVIINKNKHAVWWILPRNRKPVEHEGDENTNCN